MNSNAGRDDNSDSQRNIKKRKELDADPDVVEISAEDVRREKLQKYEILKAEKAEKDVKCVMETLISEWPSNDEIITSVSRLRFDGGGHLPEDFKSTYELGISQLLESGDVTVGTDNGEKFLTLTPEQFRAYGKRTLQRIESMVGAQNVQGANENVEIVDVDEEDPIEAAMRQILEAVQRHAPGTSGTGEVVDNEDPGINSGNAGATHARVGDPQNDDADMTDEEPGVEDSNTKE